MSPAYRLVDVATQAYGLTVGGLVLLFTRNPCICSLASNPMTRSAGTDKTRRIAVPSQYDSPESPCVASIFWRSAPSPLWRPLHETRDRSARY